MPSHLLPRTELQLAVRDALGCSRAVVLNGARQSGKSTIAQDWLARRHHCQPWRSKLYVVYPGAQRFMLADGIEAVPLWALLPWRCCRWPLRRRALEFARMKEPVIRCPACAWHPKTGSRWVCLPAAPNGIRSGPLAFVRAVRTAGTRPNALNAASPRRTRIGITSPKTKTSARPSAPTKKWTHNAARAGRSRRCSN